MPDAGASEPVAHFPDDRQKHVVTCGAAGGFQGFLDDGIGSGVQLGEAVAVELPRMLARARVDRCLEGFPCRLGAIVARPAVASLEPGILRKFLERLGSAAGGASLVFHRVAGSEVEEVAAVGCVLIQPGPGAVF